MGVRIRVDNKVCELGDSSVADLAERLRHMGVYERGENGERVAVSASARAAEALRAAVHSREVIDLDSEELGSVRAAIEFWANDVRGGFDALSDDLVNLRHAIADRAG